MEKIYPEAITVRMTKKEAIEIRKRAKKAKMSISRYLINKGIENI